MKNWKLPAIILVLLILASIFRWGTLGSSVNQYNKVTSIHKVDRWNGAIYQYAFYNTGVQESLEKPPSINMGLFYSVNLSVIRNVALGISIIWMLYAVGQRKKNKEIIEESR
jgi:hypothetical protein